MLRRAMHYLPRYGLGLAISLLALLLTLIFAQLAEPSPYPFLAAAIALSVWYGGLGPGLFSAIFATLATDSIFVHSNGTISPGLHDLARLVMFVLVVFLTSAVIESRKRAAASLREAERTRETAELYAQSEERSRELEALYRADEQLYRNLRLDQVLQALVDVVIDLLHADKASVQVWDAQSERLVVRATRAYSPEMIALMSSYRPGDGIAGQVFLTGEAVAIEDARNAPPPADRIAEVEGIRSVLSVPITIDGQIFGVFGMDYCQPRSFSAADKHLFLALTQRAAMAIENASLYEQAEQAAILEERQRLARELHDSVTQSLYSVMLLAEAGRRMTSASDLHHTEQYLTRIGETAQQALKEMRLMVFEMRPLALQNAGLVEALQQRLDAVEKRSGIQARLLVTGRLALPAHMEEELYRIAQEALNNSLKHAASTVTTVRIHADQAGIQVTVTDNGKGFDPQAIGDQGGMGMSSMRERAGRLRGELAIQSTPGEGTTIQIQVPVPC